MADVMDLLKNNGCDVRSAAVWTHHKRVAFVISVVERQGGQPIRDMPKLARLKQVLTGMMDPAGNSIVNVSVVKGLIHYERRLHQLLLKVSESATHLVAVTHIAHGPHVAACTWIMALVAASCVVLSGSMHALYDGDCVEHCGLACGGSAAALLPPRQAPAPTIAA